MVGSSTCVWLLGWGTGLGFGLLTCRNCSEVEGDAARDRLRGIEAGDADLARVRARIRLGSRSGLRLGLGLGLGLAVRLGLWLELGLGLRSGLGLGLGLGLGGGDHGEAAVLELGDEGP